MSNNTDVTLRALTGSSELINDYDAYGLLTADNLFTLYASGTVLTGGTLNQYAPTVTLSAYSGGTMSAQAPAVTMTASGTVENMGRLDESVPEIVLDAFASQESLGTFYTVLRDLFTLDAYGSGTLQASVPLISITASGIQEGFGVFTGDVPSITLTASASVRDINYAYLNVPDIVSLYGAAELLIPSIVLLAEGTNPTAQAQTISIVMNTKNAAISEHELSFDNILEVSGKYYGVMSDGLYLLEGNTFNGSLISATVETVPFRRADSGLFTIPYAWLRVRTEKPFMTRSNVDETYSSQYISQNMINNLVYNWRVKMGRGVKGVHFGFEITNTEGADFQLQSIDFEVLELSRRR